MVKIFFGGGGEEGWMGGVSSERCLKLGGGGSLAEFTLEFSTWCYFLHRPGIYMMSIFCIVCVRVVSRRLYNWLSLSSVPTLLLIVKIVPQSNPIESIYTGTMYCFDAMSKVCIAFFFRWCKCLTTTTLFFSPYPKKTWIYTSEVKTLCQKMTCQKLWCKFSY